MRYRGGGIGHKYMRAIETGYENMSRERIHHKERRRAARSQETTMDTNDTEGTNIDNSDSEGEAEAPVHRAGQDMRAGGRGRDASNNNNNDSGGDDDDDEDYEYVPASDESGSSGISDSDELDSDGCEGYEGTHGLAVP